MSFRVSRMLSEYSGMRVRKQQKIGEAQLVEALRYKPEGCGFDSRWSHWNFSVT
jgi:hypothetical protein